MIMKTKVTIDGVDVTTKIIKYECIEDYGDGIDTGSLELALSVESLVPVLKSGLSVLIQRGFTTSTDETIFDGQLTQVTKQIDRYVIVIRDKLIEAIKKNITKSWDINIDSEGGVGSEIFKDIVNNFVGLTADNTSVTSTGVLDSDKLKKFIARNEDAYSKMVELADIYNFVIKSKPETGKIWFFPKGDNNYGGATVGNEVVNTPKWKENAEQLRNKVIVNGAAVQDKITQTFSGDGSTTKFTLNKTPEDTKVTLGGVEQLRGVVGSTIDYDYVVDKELKTFTFTTAPPIGTDNIVIVYGAMIPVPVVVKNQSSIETYGGPNQTPNEYVKQLQGVVTVSDAEQYARGILERYGTPFNQTTILLSNDKISSDRPNVGDFINVVDPFQNKDLTLIITQIKRTYPHSNDTLVVGDEQWRTQDFTITTEEKIRSLLEQLNQNQDILVQLFELNREIPLSRRYLKIIKKQYPSYALIWGSPTNGIWGAKQWISANDAAITSELNRMVQSKNIYKEFLYDNDFEDNTGTATWNTTTKELTFTSGQNIKTNIIALGPTYNFFTVNIANPTGTFLYEISPDNGATWQTVTLDTKTAFTTSSNLGVIFRITENAASTGTINNTYKADGSYDEPAIKITLEE